MVSLFLPKGPRQPDNQPAGASTPPPIPAESATQQAAEKPTPFATPPAEPGTVVLRRQDYGDAWLFKADEATLRCRPSIGAFSGRPTHDITVTADGVTYAVNGTAKGKAKSNGWEDLDSLYPKSAVGLDLTPEDIKFRQELVDRGLKLCDK